MRRSFPTPTLAYSPAAAAEFHRAQTEISQHLAAEVKERLDSYTGEWSIVTPRGHVTQELLGVAETTNADIIVVGHRSHGPLRDAILGSVAAGVVHRSRRTVLVAIPKRESSGEGT